MATNVLAGEINLFDVADCAAGKVGVYLTFAAEVSEGCIAFPDNSGIVAMASARNIAPVCVFKTYYDDKCQFLAHTINTAQGSGKCLTAQSDIQAFSISCDEVPSKSRRRQLLGQAEDVQEGSFVPSSSSGRLVRRGSNDYLWPGNIFRQGPEVVDDDINNGEYQVEGNQSMVVDTAVYRGGVPGPPGASVATDAASLQRAIVLAALATPDGDQISLNPFTTTQGVVYRIAVTPRDNYGTLGAVLLLGPAVLG